MLTCAVLSRSFLAWVRDVGSGTRCVGVAESESDKSDESDGRSGSESVSSRSTSPNCAVSGVDYPLTSTHNACQKRSLFASSTENEGSAKKLHQQDKRGCLPVNGQFSL